MPIDPTFHEQNLASTQRMKDIASRLSDEQLQTRVGEHWTVAIVYAHLAWWDRRVMYVLDMTQKNGELFIPEIDIFVNDLSLPLWAAIPPREAVRIGIKTADDLDNRIQSYDPKLRELIFDYNKRWVIRGLHRNEHLNQAEAALTK